MFDISDIQPNNEKDGIIITFCETDGLRDVMTLTLTMDNVDQIIHYWRENLSYGAERKNKHVLKS